MFLWLWQQRRVQAEAGEGMHWGSNATHLHHPHLSAQHWSQPQHFHPYSCCTSSPCVVRACRNTGTLYRYVHKYSCMCIYACIIHMYTHLLLYIFLFKVRRIFCKFLQLSIIRFHWQWCSTGTAQHCWFVGSEEVKQEMCFYEQG